MAAKPKITTKVSRNAKTASLTMPPAQFEAMLLHLPEDAPLRATLEAMLADASRIKFEDDLKDEMAQPLSVTSLTRYGWDIAINVDDKAIITHGARHGDFRLDREEGTEGWVFGPSGAFDREDNDTVVMRGAWQPGVFCAKHNIYKLEAPLMSQDAARKQGEVMFDEWSDSVPKNLKKANKPRYQDEKHPDLPEDAQLFYGPQSGYHLSTVNRQRPSDYEGKNGESVFHLKFDAYLNVSFQDSLKALRWVYAREEFDPKWNTLRYPLTGPLDCVLGNVWGTAGSRIYNQQISSLERLPLSSEEDALAAAKNMAIKSGLIEGEPVSDPEPITIPSWAAAVAYGDPSPFA